MSYLNIEKCVDNFLNKQKDLSKNKRQGRGTQLLGDVSRSLFKFSESRHVVSLDITITYPNLAEIPSYIRIKQIQIIPIFI